MSSGPEAGDVFVRVADVADVAIRPGVQQAGAELWESLQGRLLPAAQIQQAYDLWPLVTERSYCPERSSVRALVTA
jgi:hypothetical protein